MGVVNAQAMDLLCVLLESRAHQVLPDAVWLGGQTHVYQRLRDHGFLGFGAAMASAVLCPDCRMGSVYPGFDVVEGKVKYSAYCMECGPMTLTKEQVWPWSVNPARVATLIKSALKLSGMAEVAELVPGRLWHLGDREHKRVRRGFFFGCQLVACAVDVRDAMASVAAPGSEVLITTSEPPALLETSLRDKTVIPLRAIAGLRKGHFSIESLDAYLSRLVPVEQTNETSLRLLRSKQVALLDGQEVRLSPQEADFLLVLLDADGDEVTKRQIAAATGIKANFVYADIKKRRKAVFDTFVQSDQQGRYWIRPEYLLEAEV